MDVRRIFGYDLLLTFFLCCVNGQTSEPFFLVTFPAVIQSGSEAKLCTSVLKPRDGLMAIHLVGNDNQTTLLLQKTTNEELHHCFIFQAPRVDGESVQKIRVEVKGRSFNLAEERKVMFRSYYPLTFIQTDKPIYNPGQMVHFRPVTMDRNFVPLDQMYSMVVVEDSQSNRIGQWTNVSSIRWILQLSHQLNSEARQGMYALKAYIGERMIVHNFEVKKYVLPKFEVTVKAAQTHSVGEEELKIEVCGKYTYNQPVPGRAWVEVCRNPFEYVSVPGVVRPCLNKTAEVHVEYGDPIEGLRVKSEDRAGVTLTCPLKMED